MAELFRFIEQAFVLPSTTPGIDLERESELQDGLRDAILESLPPDRIREIANNFLLQHFSSSVADSIHLETQYLSFARQLPELRPPGTQAVEQLVSKVFGSDASILLGSEKFHADKALLDDALVSIKILTAFDRVNAHNLVAMRQAIAFIEDFAAGKVAVFTAEGIGKTLRRPIRIPSEFVGSLTINSEHPQPPPVSDPAALQRRALMDEQQHLKSAYEAIMALQPNQFELRPLPLEADRRNMTAANTDKRVSRTEMSFGARLLALFGLRDERGANGDAGPAAPTVLSIPHAAMERLGGDVRKTLEKANIDVAYTSAAEVIAAIKREWQDVSRQLAPYQVPAPAKVFRVGVHLFAVSDTPSTTVPGRKETL